MGDLRNVKQIPAEEGRASGLYFALVGLSNLFLNIFSKHCGECDILGLYFGTVLVKRGRKGRCALRSTTFYVILEC